MDKVRVSAHLIKMLIDLDIPEDVTDKIVDQWGSLTNDEKVEVQKLLKVRAIDCNRMYSTILKEYLGTINNRG